MLSPLYRLFITFSIFLSIIAIAIIVYTSSTLPIESFQEASKLQRIGQVMEEEFNKTRDLTTNTVPRERLLEAKKILQQKLATGNKAAIPGIEWEERGPNATGGRTRSILIDLNDPDYSTIWAGSVSGGLWKTTNFFDREPTWEKVDDFFDNLAITAIIQDPIRPNRMYFGTGEGWFNSDASRGLGIWESTDSGHTWHHLTETTHEDFSYILDLAIDNNGHLYAATRKKGIQCRVLGETNWETVLANGIGGGISDLATDLEINTNGEIFASFGNFSNGSVWKSSININPIGSLNTWVNISPNDQHGRIEIAISPSNPNRVYLVAQSSANNNDVDGIYRSDNGGATWTTLNLPDFNFSRGQAWYDLIAAVDPNDEDIIYASAVFPIRSTNGGMTWEKLSDLSTSPLDANLGGSKNIHTDHHEIIFFPGSSTEAVWGTDGGVYYSKTSLPIYGPSFFNKNKGYNTTQFYSVALHPHAGVDFLLGGTQDNGTHSLSVTGISKGQIVAGGDGGYCHIDQEDPNFQFASYTNNNFLRSTNGGISFQAMPVNRTGFFINPSDYDNQAHHLYSVLDYGRYLRWTDARTSQQFDEVDLQLDISISAITCDPHVNNRVWFAGSHQLLYADQAHTNNPSTHLIDLPDEINIIAHINNIAVDPEDGDHLLISITNYGQPSVWEVKNATTGNPEWYNLDSNLPDIPVRWAIFNPANSDQALLATEMGVWTTDNINGQNTDWAPSNNGLAKVRVDMLQYRQSDNTIVAGTHGRGIFTTQIQDTNIQELEVSFNQPISFANEIVQVETGDCQESYIELSVPITINEFPIQPIIVSLELNENSTTTPQRDFDLENSITTLTFTSTSTLSQDFKIRLYDDAIIEEEETIILDLVITNPSTNTKLGNFPSHTIQVSDNDINPVNPASQAQTFFRQDFSKGLGSEVQAVDELGNGNWDVSHDGPQSNPQMRITSPTADNGFVIFDSENYNNDGLPEQAFLALAPIDCSNHENIKLHFYQQYCHFAESTVVEVSNNGEDFTPFPVNVLFLFDECTGTADFQTLDISSIADKSSSVYIRFRYTGNYDYWWQIDDVSLTGNIQVQPETSVSKQKSSYLATGETAHFYSETQQIIASVTALEADLGCVKLSTERAGRGKQTINHLQGGSRSITDKVFNISAEYNHPYQVTFYFTEEELEIWGNQSDLLNIFHSTKAIQKVEESEISIIPNTQITARRYADNRFIQYQTVFTESGSFALTDANSVNNVDNSLPVELLSFTGTAQNKSIELKWETALEINTEYFLLEHSKDGQNFDYFEKVAAQGNSTSSKWYQISDNNPSNGVNYYRLTAYDFDDKNASSSTIAINFENFSTTLQVFPNPIQGEYLQFEWNSQTHNHLKVSILQLSGQQIFTQQVSISENEQTHSLSIPNLPSGIYILQVQDLFQTQVERIIIP